MFTKSIELKKLMKEASESNILIVSRKENMLLIQGGYWIYWCNMELMSKRAMGALVECAGTIPGDGESFRVGKKTKPQYEFTETVHWDIVYELNNIAAKGKVFDTEKTGIIVQRDSGSFMRLMEQSNGENYYIREGMWNMVSEKEMEDDEEHPGGMLKSGMWSYWTNQEELFGVMQIITDDDDWREILRKKITGDMIG